MVLAAPLTEKAFARKVVVFLADAPAATTGIPTLTEVNAAFFASLHLYTPFNVTPDQSTGQGPRKLGSESVPTQNGTVTYPAVEAQGSYLPQQLGTAGAPGNELYELMRDARADGERITTVVFDALNGDIDTIPADSVGDVYLVEPGKIRKGSTGDGEFDEIAFTVGLVIAGGQPIAEDHVFAA